MYGMRNMKDAEREKRNAFAMKCQELAEFVDDVPFMGWDSPKSYVQDMLVRWSRHFRSKDCAKKETPNNE